MGAADLLVCRYSKQSEFYLWLREVKNIEPETLPVYAMTEHFETYAEDYNTVTFPDDKYYNLEVRTARQDRTAGRTCSSKMTLLLRGAWRR